MAETFTSKADVPIRDQEAFLAFWRAELEDHGFDYTQPAPHIFTVSHAYGRVEIRAEDGRGYLEISSPAESFVTDLREGLSHHLAEFDPALENVAWSGVTNAGSFPHNFRAAKVIACENLSPSYIRMTLQGDDIGRFFEEHMHFRLLRQQNPERPPVWPVMSARGVADWPEGEDELAAKVYTTRFFDAEKGTLTFDIFRHEGGFTSEWAETAPLGQIVGLLGPGGGGVPEADWLLLSGDETAVPAILRILEELPRNAKGHALMLVGDEADIQPVAAPEGIEIRWLLRAPNVDLVAETTAISRPDGGMVWFAAENSEARAVRQHFVTETGAPKASVMSIAYWK